MWIKGSWLWEIRGSIGQRKLHWGSDIQTKIQKIWGINSMTVGGSEGGCEAELRTFARSFVVNREYCVLERTWYIQGPRKRPLRLEHIAERMVQDKWKVDRNQNRQRLVGCIQDYGLYQKCNRKTSEGILNLRVVTLRLCNLSDFFPSNESGSLILKQHSQDVWYIISFY